MEAHLHKSSEVIIPVLEHGRLHFGSGRFFVLEIMIKSQLGHKTWSALETHEETLPEVIIPVLEHALLHLGSGHESVREIVITIAINHRPH